MRVGGIWLLLRVVEEDGEELVEGYGMEGEEGICHEVDD
jgi:hypothetical protein